MKKSPTVVIPSAVLAELRATHNLALNNQKLLNEIKTNLAKTKQSSARQISTTIFTSIILAIFFIAVIGIIIMALCLAGYLAPLAMILGTSEIISLALVACSIVSVVSAIAVICLFIHGRAENKVAIQ